MSYYKDLNNKTHVIDPEFSYMLPNGCIEITQAEFLSISNQKTTEQLAAIAQAAADKIESDNAKADLAVQYLITHTLGQINTYVKGQVKADLLVGLTVEQLAAFKAIETLVVKLACVVSVLAKDKLR